MKVLSFSRVILWRKSFLDRSQQTLARLTHTYLLTYYKPWHKWNGSYGTLLQWRLTVPRLAAEILNPLMRTVAIMGTDLSVRVPGCQKLQMAAYPGLVQNVTRDPWPSPRPWRESITTTHESWWDHDSSRLYCFLSSAMMYNLEFWIRVIEWIYSRSGSLHSAGQFLQAECNEYFLNFF